MNRNVYGYIYVICVLIFGMPHVHMLAYKP